ncbi:MAG: hypothetical protein K6F32_07665 [Bacilli bacterium]|nr:hypothetical protein [Bacilli bacterium]
MKINDATHIFVAALIHSSGRFLLCRKLDSGKGIPTPYHFPGGQISEGGSVEEKAKRLLEVKYNAQVRFTYRLTPSFDIRSDGARDVMIPLICEESTPLRFPPEMVGHVFVGKENIDALPIDSLDRFVLRKAIAYMPALRAPQRTSPLTVAEAQKVASMEDCLEFFENRVPKEKKNEFTYVIRRQVPYSLISECFFLLLEECRLSYQEYLEFTRIRKAKSL